MGGTSDARWETYLFKNKIDLNHCTLIKMKKTIKAIPADEYFTWEIVDTYAELIIQEQILILKIKYLNNYTERANF